jgi:hypothetical protein
VRLTEQAFAEQFHELVAHLAERLKGDADGKPKTFRDTAVENLNAFFEQFRSSTSGAAPSCSAGRSGPAGGAGRHARRAAGTTRTSRATVAASLAEIQQAMDALMVNKPKRAISLEERRRRRAGRGDRGRADTAIVARRTSGDAGGTAVVGGPVAGGRAAAGVVPAADGGAGCGAVVAGGAPGIGRRTEVVMERAIGAVVAFWASGMVGTVVTMAILQISGAELRIRRAEAMSTVEALALLIVMWPWTVAQMADPENWGR